MVRQCFRLVDRNQRSTVVNPHQAGVLETLRQPFSVDRRHFGEDHGVERPPRAR